MCASVCALEGRQADRSQIRAGPVLADLERGGVGVKHGSPGLGPWDLARDPRKAVGVRLVWGVGKWAAIWEKNRQRGS